MTRALRIPVEGPVEVVDVDGLVAYQKQVGGYIEYTDLFDNVGDDEQWVAVGQSLVINEEGKYNGSKMNKVASILFATTHHGDPIMGDALVIGNPDRAGNDVDVDLEVVVALLARRAAELVEVAPR